MSSHTKRFGDPFLRCCISKLSERSFSNGAKPPFSLDVYSQRSCTASLSTLISYKELGRNRYEKDVYFYCESHNLFEVQGGEGKEEAGESVLDPGHVCFEIAVCSPLGHVLRAM